MSSTTGFSRRLQVTSLACGVLLVVLKLLFAVLSMTLPLSVPFVPWYLGWMAACIGIPFAIWYFVGRPELRRPPALGLDAAHAQYVVGAQPGRTAWGLFMLANGTVMPLVERVPNTDRVRLSTVPGVVPFAAGILGFSIVVALAMIFVQRPTLRLDPDGVTRFGILSRAQRIAWDDIAPRSATLHPWGGSGSRVVWHPSAPGRPGMTSFPLHGLHVDPVFLLHAVRVYADDPARRAEIGTQAGLDRLQRERSDALAAGFVPVR